MDRAESFARAMAAVGLGVGALAAASPRALLALYGVAPAEVTGAAAFGWRMFAVRNLVVSGAALRGNHAARAAFLPVQLGDQLVFAHAMRTRAVPRRSAALAMATSGAIVALDLAARRGASAPRRVRAAGRARAPASG